MTSAPQRILVVDDDATARLLMRAALKKSGFEIVLAEGGRQALETFAAARFDMVMLDVDMPDLDGHAVCAAMRAAVGDLLPIVMVTGMDDVGSIERAYESGATDFIVKPINWILLGHRIRYMFRTLKIQQELQAVHARNAKLAFLDVLTGLPNRQSFLDRLSRELGSARGDGSRLAVLFLDLDGFKQINDTMGHSVGDLLLQSAADRLREVVRPSDMISRPAEAELARLGGDEFTILLPRIADASDALAVAGRIGEAMRRPFPIENRQIRLTTSIGVALHPDDGRDAETLIKHADTAMYHAKNSGRDTARLYSAALTEAAMRRLELDSDLRQALERNEFHLLYQPQLDVRTGRITSVEALVRWNHPRLGLVPPMEFIPRAEENGLILPLGRWVLRTACADAARWRKAYSPLVVAVNLSPMQFKDPDLVGLVLSALAEAALPAEALELELTESAVMENLASTAATLTALRDRGIKIALDDFGTGYSSLSQLTRMPISNLKIDRSFVGKLPDDGEHSAIVRAIVAMGDSLGMRVTAEGVETLEQALALRAMACDSLQGFYVSHPVPASDILPLAQQRWTLEPTAAPLRPDPSPAAGSEAVADLDPGHRHDLAPAYHVDP